MSNNHFNLRLNQGNGETTIKKDVFKLALSYSRDEVVENDKGGLPVVYSSSAHFFNTS